MGLHETMARAAFPPGCILRCYVCKREESMGAHAGAEYLRSGWPLCHGETMELLTPKQLEAEGGAREGESAG